MLDSLYCSEKKEKKAHKNLLHQCFYFINNYKTCKIFLERGVTVMFFNSFLEDNCNLSDWNNDKSDEVGISSVIYFFCVYLKYKNVSKNFINSRTTIFMDILQSKSNKLLI